MKWMLFCFVSLVAFVGFSQTIKLKKKYLKVYEGTLPEFSINTGKELVNVASEKVKLTLQIDSLYFVVGSIKYSGSYSVQKSSKTTLSIVGKMNETSIPEELVLNTKTKTITRKGVFPQAVVDLKMVD